MWPSSAGRIAHCEGPRPTSACPYIRVSFASAADADLEEGIKRLATVIKSFQQETAAKAKTNGNAVGGSGPAAFHGGYGNGNTENGSHVQQQSTEGSVQQILHDNEKMGLAAAIRTAANSQPEGC